MGIDRKDKDMKLKKSSFLKFGVILFLLQPFYLYLLNTFKIYQLPLSLAAMMSFCYCIQCVRKSALKCLLPWAILFMYMGIHNVGSADLAMYHFFCLIMMLSLTQSQHWQKSVSRILLWMSVPHVIATVVFFLVPPLYSMVRPLISAENIMYEGYRTGLTGHYSTNSIYISCSFLLYASLYLCREKRQHRFMLLGRTLISLLALILTTKRGPLLCSAAALFITYLLTDRKRLSSRFVKATLVCMITGMGVYLFGDHIPVIASIIERFKTDGASGREKMFVLAISMFLKNPILGQGTGSYRLSYFAFLAKDTNHMYLNAHNVYLQLLAENGIVGLSIFFTAVLLTLHRAVGLLRKFHSIGVKDKERMMTISVAYQVFFLLYCMSGNPLYDSMVYIPFFICCAMTYSYYLGEKNG